MKNKNILIAGLVGLILISGIGYFANSLNLFKGQVAQTGKLIINQSGTPSPQTINFLGREQGSSSQANFEKEVALPGEYVIQPPQVPGQTVEVTDANGNLIAGPDYLQFLDQNNNPIIFNVQYTQSTPANVDVTLEQSPLEGSIELTTPDINRPSVNISQNPFQDSFQGSGDYTIKVTPPANHIIESVKDANGNAIIPSGGTSDYTQSISQNAPIAYLVNYAQLPDLEISQFPVGEVALIDSNGTTVNNPLTGISTGKTFVKKGDYSLQIKIPSNFNDALVELTKNGNTNTLSAPNYNFNLDYNDSALINVTYRTSIIGQPVPANQGTVSVNQSHSGTVQLVNVGTSQVSGQSFVNGSSQNFPIGTYDASITPPPGRAISSVNLSRNGTSSVLPSTAGTYTFEIRDQDIIIIDVQYTTPNPGTTGAIEVQQFEKKTMTALAGKKVEIVSTTNPANSTLVNNTSYFDNAFPSGTYEVKVDPPTGYDVESVLINKVAQVFPYQFTLSTSGNVLVEIFYQSTQTGNSGAGATVVGELIIEQIPILNQPNIKAQKIEIKGAKTYNIDGTLSGNIFSDSAAPIGDYMITNITPPQGYVVKTISKTDGSNCSTTLPCNQLLAAGQTIKFVIEYLQQANAGSTSGAVGQVGQSSSSKDPSFRITKNSSETLIANNNKRVNYTIEVERTDANLGLVEVEISDSMSNNQNTNKGTITVNKGDLNYQMGTFKCSSFGGAVCDFGGINDGLGAGNGKLRFDAQGDKVVIVYQMLSDNKNLTFSTDFPNTVRIDYKDSNGNPKFDIANHSVFIPSRAGAVNPNNPGNPNPGGQVAGPAPGGSSSSSGGGGALGRKTSKDIDVSAIRTASVDGGNTYKPLTELKLVAGQPTTVDFKIEVENKSNDQITDVRFKQVFNSGTSGIGASAPKNVRGAVTMSNGDLRIADIPRGSKHEFFYKIDIKEVQPTGIAANENLEFTTYFSSPASLDPKLKKLGIGTKFDLKIIPSSGLKNPTPAGNPAAQNPPSNSGNNAAGSGGSGTANNTPSSSNSGGGGSSSQPTTPAGSKATIATGSGSGNNIAPNTTSNNTSVGKSNLKPAAPEEPQSIDLSNNKTQPTQTQPNANQGAQPVKSDKLSDTGLESFMVVIASLLFAGGYLMGRRESLKSSN